MMQIDKRTLWGIGGISAAALSAVVIWRQLKRPAKENYPRDIVILHQVGRGRYAPSISPFPLKLETYLRMANIPYKTIHSWKLTPKHKTPWITYNGHVISDTNFIIEFLNEEFKVDLNSHLSSTERAVARAFLKMTEEDMYWAGFYDRYLSDRQSTKHYFPKGIFYQKILLMIIKRQMMKNFAYPQGMGRHTQEEVYSIAEKDIRALSVFLGDKKFFFGDEPCEEDAAFFGSLAQGLWQMPGSPAEELIHGDCKNLKDYCHRIKERFWPDWEQCIMGDVEYKSILNFPECDPVLFKE